MPMIDRSEVDQMSKFMTALNGMSAFDDSSAVAPVSEAVSRPSPIMGEGIAEMKSILERFYTATERVISEQEYDQPLREALATERTSTGARIGSWEIRLNESGKRTLYDVVNVLSGEALASDLLLYEAAYGLVRILNNGGKINSREALDLMRAERDYAGSVHDMALFKHRLIHNPDSPRVHVFEARYGDAKRRALSARDRVSDLADGR